jgi:hypothetical protein
MPISPLAQIRLKKLVNEILREKQPQILAQLDEINFTYFKRQGKITPPYISDTLVQWTLRWTTIHNIVWSIELALGLADNGREAEIIRVMIRRLAQTPYTYEDHTPTTIMKSFPKYDLNQINAALHMMVSTLPKGLDSYSVRKDLRGRKEDERKL